MLSLGSGDKSSYLVDDALSDFAKVERYLGSHLPLQRMVYVKQVAHVAHVFGARAALRLIPQLWKLASDSEVAIRQSLASELALLAEEVWRQSRGQATPAAAAANAKPRPPPPPHPKPSATNTHNTRNGEPQTNLDPDSPEALYRAIPDHLFRIAYKLLLDASHEVRPLATETLIKLASFMSEHDNGAVFLKTVLLLAHDDDEEKRITAATLLTQSAESMGPQLCRHFVAHELVSFADDPTFRVRRVAAFGFGHIARVVGADFTRSRLLDAFIKLSRDRIWGVRKGCVQSLPTLANVLEPDAVADSLVPMVLSFADDASRWVRNAVLEQLGAFVHAYGKTDPSRITDELVSLYVRVPQMPSARIDHDVLFAFAFHFPAVVFTLGRARFVALLPAFQALARDKKFQIRKTLASSLHELAKIVGTELTEAHIVPVFDRFLRDLNEVRAGTVDHLADFLAVLSPERRERYIETLVSITTAKPKKWRWRLKLARQIGDIAALYDPETVIQRIAPVFLGLCRDTVQLVRERAAAAAGAMLRAVVRAGQEPDGDADGDSAGEYSLRAQLEEQVELFSSHSIYKNRQLYLIMAGSIFRTHTIEYFTQRCLLNVIRLASDPVPNVRMSAARLVSILLDERSPLNGESQLTVLRQQLERDGDRDVASAAVHRPADDIFLHTLTRQAEDSLAEDDEDDDEEEEFSLAAHIERDVARNAASGAHPSAGSVSPPPFDDEFSNGMRMGTPMVNSGALGGLGGDSDDDELELLPDDGEDELASEYMVDAEEPVEVEHEEEEEPEEEHTSPGGSPVLDTAGIRPPTRRLSKELILALPPVEESEKPDEEEEEEEEEGGEEVEEEAEEVEVEEVEVEEVEAEEVEAEEVEVEEVPDNEMQVEDDDAAAEAAARTRSGTARPGDFEAAQAAFEAEQALAHLDDD